MMKASIASRNKQYVILDDCDFRFPGTVNDMSLYANPIDEVGTDRQYVLKSYRDLAHSVRDIWNAEILRCKNQCLREIY